MRGGSETSKKTKKKGRVERRVEKNQLWDVSVIKYINGPIIINIGCNNVILFRHTKTTKKQKRKMDEEREDKCCWTRGELGGERGGESIVTHGVVCL